jgi:hypothetical protein
MSNLDKLHTELESRYKELLKDGLIQDGIEEDSNEFNERLNQDLGWFQRDLVYGNTWEICNMSDITKEEVLELCDECWHKDIHENVEG